MDCFKKLVYETRSSWILLCNAMAAVAVKKVYRAHHDEKNLISDDQ
jgi:hypothetical protein